MKKFLFALILCFPLFLKFDSFAVAPRPQDGIENYYLRGTIVDNGVTVIRSIGFSNDGLPYAYWDTGSSGKTLRALTNGTLYFFLYVSSSNSYSSIGNATYSRPGSTGIDENYFIESNVIIYDSYSDALFARNNGLSPLLPTSNYDSSILSGLLWHNSFYLGSADTYEVVSFSHTLSGNVLNGDNKSTILEIYVNDVQKDVITKEYNPINSVFDGINFHHSDYGINNGDTIRVRAYYYLNNNYGNYKEISWIAKNKLDNSDNLITNPSGEHGGGGSERNPIETTIKNPYTPSTPSGQPPKELAPIQTTITQQQVVEVNPTTEQTVTVQNIYIQGYEIPDYPNYEDQLNTIEELLKGVNSGDTITNITNNYEYTYNYNFDFDIDFGDLNLDHQDLKSFIQDFPSFSEKYISFLSSFGVPVWLVVLIVSCFGLIFVALLIKIAKLFLPI